MNSLSNGNMATSTSLNDQKKKEQSDLFDDDDDEDILYNDEEENEIFREYNLINDRKLRVMDDMKNMNERIKNNKTKIEEYKNNLKELKEEKKKKQGDIMNLLSNKESIEEIYKNQLYILHNSNYNGSNSNNYNENITSLANDIHNLNNLINDNSKIDLNSNHNITLLDNEILNTDEDNFKIPLEEIKESDQKKYIEQVINMFEDIFKKKDENINTSITNIINNSYELFINNNKEEENEELTVTNFFSKISLFIANQSLGKCPEMKINLLLRYLLKINYISNKLSKYIKFVNKKYKERKKELNDMISFLEKKNINLTEKNNRLENNMKDYDDKIFFDKNDNDNDNDELSHEVVIEYENGIDKNAEINYEDDIINDNEYDIEKENEMMNKGLNPYNINNNNIKQQKPLYKNDNKKIKQIIIKDNDESDDKCLNELLDNKEENKTRNKYKNNKNDLDKNKNEDLNNKSGEMFKKIKYNNEKNIINLDKNKRLCPTPQHHIKKTEEELKYLTTIEKDHYNRVQRIMNAGPKINNIFGVNNYNPENSFNGIKEGGLFSPKKSALNIPKSSNKIDKTIKIESRQNHNFIGIINMTKNAPIKKKKRDSNKKAKDGKDEENEGGIKIINLEQDFKNEEENVDKKSNNNENNDKMNNINNNKNNNKNEVQGYYLNIINSKNVKREKNLENNTNNENNTKNNLNSKESSEISNTNLNNKRSFKITRSRELNLNDIKSKNILLTKINNYNNNLNNNATYNKTTNNDLSKRSHSLSEHQNEEKENNKNESIRNKYNSKKIIVVNSVNNNNNSPNHALKNKKIGNIPISKINNFSGKNYNANTYEKANIKEGSKFYNNKNKK